MKKEYLAVALIVICIIGAVIGIVKTYPKDSNADKQNIKTDKGSKLISMLGGDSKIALIKLNGIISDDDADSELFPSASPSNKAKKYILKATTDNSVKGVIIRINSPGGTPAASQEVYNAIMECRKKKPVVVSMGDLAASGGYYIAAAADEIVANPSTLTGSIGVIFNAMNLTDLFGKIGIKSNVIKSGKFKDIGNAARPMTPEEKALLQGLINDTYEQFIQAIIKGRIDTPVNKSKSIKHTLTEEKLRANADGRIMTGDQAEKIGLVDKLGGLEEAKTEVIKMAQERFKNVKDDIPVVSYDRVQTFAEIFTEMSSNVVPKTSLVETKLPFSVTHPNQPLWIME